MHLHLKLYEKQLTRRLEQIASMSEDYPKMYNWIISFFTSESLERVKQDTDFAAAEVDRDPILLMTICRRTHMQGQSGDDETDEDAATAVYYGCK